MFERRFLQGARVTLRSGDRPAIEGYGAVFGETYDSGYFKEQIMPGAFSKVLAGRPDVRALLNHSPDNLLGRTTANTLRLSQDSKGLRFDCDLPDTQLGRDVRTLVGRGDLTGCSFSFSVTKQNWREEKDGCYRDIVEIGELWDTGPVTYPAYDGTTVATRDLWPEGVPAEIRSHIPALRLIAQGAGRPGPALSVEQARARSQILLAELSR